MCAPVVTPYPYPYSHKYPPSPPATTSHRPPRGAKDLLSHWSQLPAVSHRALQRPVSLSKPMELLSAVKYRNDTDSVIQPIPTYDSCPLFIPAENNGVAVPICKSSTTIYSTWATLRQDAPRWVYLAPCISPANRLYSGESIARIFLRTFFAKSAKLSPLINSVTHGHYAITPNHTCLLVIVQSMSTNRMILTLQQQQYLCCNVPQQSVLPIQKINSQWGAMFLTRWWISKSAYPLYMLFTHLISRHVLVARLAFVLAYATAAKSGNVLDGIQVTTRSHLASSPSHFSASALHSHWLELATVRVFTHPVRTIAHHSFIQGFNTMLANYSPLIDFLCCIARIKSTVSLITV